MSLTTGSNPSIDAAISVISRIGDQEWTVIHDLNAFVDTETSEVVSDAEVAEIGYTAFTFRPKRRHVQGRLIVTPSNVRSVVDLVKVPWTRGAALFP